MHKDITINWISPTKGGATNSAGRGLLAHEATHVIQSPAAKSRVERELQRMGPAIKARMPKGGGVLVAVRLREFGGAQSFESLEIVGSGMSPAVAVRGYDKFHRLTRGSRGGATVLGWAT